MNGIIYWIKANKYLGIFSSLMLGMFGLPVPDESILTLTGYLISKNHLQPLRALAAAYLGSTCGITVNYLLGHTVGFHLVKRYGRILRLTPEKLERAHDWFSHHGKWALFLGYFFPGLRHLTPFVAGASRLKWPVFALFTYTGGFLWAVTFVTLGYTVGGEEGGQIPARLQLYVLMALGVFFTGLAFYWIVRQKKRQGPGRE
jgi:membrane protein DedA with SNARE-associated domain